MSVPPTSPVSDFITSTLDQIQMSVPKKARIDESVRFEMTTVSQKEKGGKASASILNFGAKVGVDITESQIQKISFAIKFPTDTELAIDAARKAQAEADRAHSKRVRVAEGKSNIRATGSKSK